MDVQEAISKARDAITVKRVYGAPYERDGITVIPAASVAGGGGGGSGEDPTSKAVGGGGGFGLTGRPVGAFVIQDGDVRWQPAFDATRIVQLALGGLLALVATGLLALLVLRSRRD